MAIRLYIDNRPADIDSRTHIAITLSIGAFTRPEESATGYTKSISIPATPTNRALMGGSEQLHSLPLFGSQHHRARIEEEGFVLMEGPIRLLESTMGGEERYRFNILGAACDWLKSARESLASLAIDYEKELNPITIAQSWTEESTPIRYLPVRRDLYTSEAERGLGIFPPARVLTADDYHPFLHIATMVEHIFKEAGYSVESRFMSGELFRTLYMSGYFSERDVAMLVEAMGFRASRFKAATATVGSGGQIFCTPLTNGPTVGNLVDTASLYATDEEGNRAFDVYDNGGCFVTDESGRVCFKPLEEVSVSFKYNFHYLTDYRMISSQELAGFNTIRLDGDDVRKFTIINPYPDKKEEINSGMEYRVVAFGASDSAYHILYGWEELEDGTVRSVRLADFYGSEAIFISNDTVGKVRNLSLMRDGALYEGDWAVYNGHISTTGQREVKITLTGRRVTATSGNPAYFDMVCFEGGEEGMSLTLLPDTSITPIFNPHPGEGSVITFADVARHNCSRLDLLAAIRQMFNLRFYTDAIARKVMIEPLDEFYNRHMVDWSDKVDLNYPIVVEEIGKSAPREVVWRYREGDGAVARYDSAHGVVLGCWEATVASAVTSTTRSVSVNPLFTPTLSQPSSLQGSPSATLITVGDRQRLVRGGDSLNFPAKVVRYSGMVPLPEGERWDWPGYGDSYPYLAFHSPEQGWTLGFENRDGVVGLHSYWDSTVDTLSNARRVTLYLHLTPTDVEPLAMPDRLANDFRALYRLTIDGEPALYRLEEVCDYNPEQASVKCKFVQVLKV